MPTIRQRVIDWLGNTLSDSGVDAEVVSDVEDVVWVEVAREIVSSYISACLTRCEFRFIGRDGQPSLDNDAWLWNVSPNPNQSRAEMMGQLVRRLLVTDGRALVVPVRRSGTTSIYVADNFPETVVAGGENTYANVSVEGSTVPGRKRYRASEVYAFRVTDPAALALMRRLDAQYDRLAESFVSASRSRNASQWLLSLDQPVSGTDEQVRKAKDYIEGSIRRFVTSQNAVMPMYRGMGLQKLSTDSTRGQNGAAGDVLGIRKDAFEMVAETYRVPTSLLYGNTNNFAEVFNAMLTVAVDDKARLISDELTRKTYTPEEWAAGCRVVVDTTHVRHVDVFAVAQQAQALVGSGIDSPNEVRGFTGQPPIGEPWADGYQMTLNNQSATDAAGA